jgi:hypothetical protein
VFFKGREANRTKNVDIKFSNFGIQYNVGRSTEIVGTLYYINIKRLLRKRWWWWSSYGVLSVLLRFTDSDYPLWYLQTLLVSSLKQQTADRNVTQLRHTILIPSQVLVLSP